MRRVSPKVRLRLILNLTNTLLDFTSLGTYGATSHYGGNRWIYYGSSFFLSQVC